MRVLDVISAAYSEPSQKVYSTKYLAPVSSVSTLGIQNGNSVPRNGTLEREVKIWRKICVTSLDESAILQSDKSSPRPSTPRKSHLSSRSPLCEISEFTAYRVSWQTQRQTIRDSKLTITVFSEVSKARNKDNFYRNHMAHPSSCPFGK